MDITKNKRTVLVGGAGPVGLTAGLALKLPNGNLSQKIFKGLVVEQFFHKATLQSLEEIYQVWALNLQRTL